MKRILPLPVICIMMLSACKENGTIINSNENYWDTSYVAPVEAVQPRNVLIEDFTGVSCTNCPQAHTIIDNIVSQNPNRVNVISIYPNFVDAKANQLTKQDFITAYGSDIDNIIYNSIQAMPLGGVDRMPYGGDLLLGRSVWPAAVNVRLAVPTPVNLSVTSSYDASGKAVIQATVTFTQDVTTKQNLSIAIVEDSIIDAQDDNNVPPPGLDTFYVFTNVFRDFVTINNTPYGDAFLATQTTIPAGTVYEKKITYTLPAAGTLNGHTINVINPAHCKVVAFVNYTNATGNKEVLQSASCKLTAP